MCFLMNYTRGQGHDTVMQCSPHTQGPSPTNKDIETCLLITNSQEVLADFTHATHKPTKTVHKKQKDNIPIILQISYSFHLKPTVSIIVFWEISAEY